MWPSDVIHGDQRDVFYQRESFRAGHTDQQRTDQAGALRGGNGRRGLQGAWRISSQRHANGGDDRREDALLREASSGTTPPYFEWVAIWEETMEERMREPSSTTAAAVSSHDDSIPRIFTVPRRFPG